jgi:hypothetical protein
MRSGAAQIQKIEFDRYIREDVNELRQIILNIYKSQFQKSRKRTQCGSLGEINNFVLTCHYLNFTNNSYMLGISQRIKAFWELRYIAVTCTLPLKSRNDDITTFFTASKSAKMLE